MTAVMRPRRVSGRRSLVFDTCGREQHSVSGRERKRPRPRPAAQPERHVWRMGHCEQQEKLDIASAVLAKEIRSPAA